VSVEVTVPNAGESIREVTLGDWAKNEGDAVSKDEVLVQVETDKASVEIPSPVSGTLETILVASGEDASPGDVVARIAREDEAKESADGDERDGPRNERDEREDEDQRGDDDVREQRDRSEPEGGDAPRDTGDDAGHRTDGSSDEGDETGDQPPREESQEREPREARDRLAPRLTPAVRRALRRSGAEPSQEQLREALEEGETDETDGERREDVVAMSPLRRTIARRLVDAQQRAALVTTFNEVDMSAVQALRERYRERFEDKHGIELGIMPFFVKAAIEALKGFPGLNAEVRGDDIAYKRYYDVGVAVATERGLVVPVLRDAHRMSFAEIERQIADFAERAGRAALEPDELEGGTFTISNGGIFGSLMSEPIVNPPQTGVLGMHAIEDRPVARDGEVVIRPMMYLALTYDHRVVDGREAVRFLKTIRDGVESPARILLEL